MSVYIRWKRSDFHMAVQPNQLYVNFSDQIFIATFPDLLLVLSRKFSGQKSVRNLIFAKSSYPRSALAKTFRTGARRRHQGATRASDGGGASR